MLCDCLANKFCFVPKVFSIIYYRNKLSLPFIWGAYGNRGGGKDKSDLEIAPPLLLLNSDIQNEQSENLESETLTDDLKFLGGLTNLDSLAYDE
jgi:hypothetical protein